MTTCQRFLIAAILLVVAITPALADRTATITLGRDPEPPFCIDNPGGIVDIFWDIEHETTPNYVYYKLEDPTRTIILEEQTYPDATGLNIQRQWVCPNGLVDGKYWVRVEYWSYEASNEANAEVTFYICTEMGQICATKYEDLNCNGELDAGDAPLANWWICLETPNDDVICMRTDENGEVCWEGIPVGDYRVFEPPVDGWIPVGPSEYEVALGAGEEVNLDFLNVRYDQCFGACCLPDGTCREMQEGACSDQDGEFYGLGSYCDDVECPQPGACCFADGHCEMLLEEECYEAGGDYWIDGEVCEPNPCTPPPPPGACCLPDGDCVFVPEAECSELGGVLWLPDEDCEPNPCPPVPTEQATWGRIKSQYR